MIQNHGRRNYLTCVRVTKCKTYTRYKQAGIEQPFWSYILHYNPLIADKEQTLLRTIPKSWRPHNLTFEIGANSLKHTFSQPKISIVLHVSLQRSILIQLGNQAAWNKLTKQLHRNIIFQIYLIKTKLIKSYRHKLANMSSLNVTKFQIFTKFMI